MIHTLENKLSHPRSKIHFRFASALVTRVKNFKLNFYSFLNSWEFPNGDGIGCNTKDASDASNLLSLLQELRADPAGGNLTLSAATSIKPWTGPDGTPLTDVSQFSQVLDFICKFFFASPPVNNSTNAFT